jgi:hypothetical protein
LVRERAEREGATDYSKTGDERTAGAPAIHASPCPFNAKSQIIICSCVIASQAQMLHELE